MGLKMNVHPWDIQNFRQLRWQQCDTNISTSRSQPDKTCSHPGWKCESFDTLGTHWSPDPYLSSQHMSICYPHRKHTLTHTWMHTDENTDSFLFPLVQTIQWSFYREYRIRCWSISGALAVTDWPVSVSSSYVIKTIGASIGTRLQHGCRETSTMKFVISAANARDY